MQPRTHAPHTRHPRMHPRAARQRIPTTARASAPEASSVSSVSSVSHLRHHDINNVTTFHLK
jgi:hypothetical protein